METTTEPQSTTRDHAVTAVRAGSIMFACMFLSRVLGMLRDTAMAAEFGIGLNTDAYRIAIAIPDTLFMLIAGGGLSSAFIPVFSEFLHTNRQKEAWKVFSVVTTISSIVVLLLIGVAWVFAPQIAAYFCADKTTFVNGIEVHAAHLLIPQVTLMGRILLPAQFAFLIGSILLGTLYARNHFLAPGMAPNVYNLGIIAGAFAGGMSHLGIIGVPWGGLIGALVGNLLLPIAVMAKIGSHFRPSLDYRAPGVRKFFVLLMPVILGFSLPSVATIITTKFAAGYPAGINTVLQYASTLMQAPLGIFGHSMALAAFPALSRFYAQNRMDLYRDQVSKTLRTVLYLSIPSSALMFAMAPEIVTLLYGYGRARQHVGPIAPALQVYAVAIFAWCIQPVLMRGFFSVHKTLKPVAIGTTMTGLFVVLCLIATRRHFSFLSLAWATDISAVLLAILLFGGLEMEVGKLDRAGTLLTIFKSLLASVAASAFAYGAFSGLHHALANPGKIVLSLVFGFVSCVSGWIYYFLTRRMHMPETAYIDRAVARFSRRSSGNSGSNSQ